MKKLLKALLIMGSLLIGAGCSQVGVVKSNGLIAGRVTDLQTNGYLNFDNIFFYLDTNDDNDFSEGIDLKIAYKDGAFVLPEVVDSLAIDTAVVRIKAKNIQSRKTYRFRNTADTTWIDVICTKGIAADKTTDVAPAGWHTRFGLGTETNKYTYKPFYPGTVVSVKVYSNPTQLTPAVQTKDTNGTVDLSHIDFYLDMDGNGSYTAGTDTAVEYRDGKLVLVDMTGSIAENKSVPILMKAKDDAAVKYSFISSNEQNWTGVVFANILQGSSTTAATQDGWYQRYNQGTEASKYTYSALTASYVLYVTIDKRGEGPGGGGENPGGGGENPGGGGENPGGGGDPGGGGENPGGGGDPGGSTVTGITATPVQTNGYVHMNLLDFYFDVNGNNLFDDETDISVSYADGKIMFPDVIGKVPSGESRALLVKPKNAQSRKTYAVRNSIDSAWYDILYLNNKDGKTGWYTCQKSTTNYQAVIDTSTVSVKVYSNPTQLTPAIQTKDTNGTVDLSQIDFYLDMNGDGSYTSGTDIVVEYKDGKLVLSDMTESVAQNTAVPLKMKPKNNLSNKTYQFRNSADSSWTDIVFANILEESAETNSTQDGWYTRFNNTKKTYSALTESTTVYVKMFANPALTPTIAANDEGGSVQLDNLEFYVDINENKAFDEGVDIALEYDTVTKKLTLPEPADVVDKIPENSYRWVRIKPINSTTYHVRSGATGGGWWTLVYANQFNDTQSYDGWKIRKGSNSYNNVTSGTTIYVRVFNTSGTLPTSP